MTDREELLRFYTEQFETESRKKQKTTRKPSGCEDRINRLSRVMKRAKAGRMSSILLEDYHRQVKNLAHEAHRSGKERAVTAVREALLPELLRLDLGLLLPEEREELNREFVVFGERMMPGAICTRPLYEIYRNYKQYTIKNKILELVPSRPELEFPEALKMRRQFYLHIGPTNSGKTYHAPQNLKDAQNGIYLGPLRLLALEVYEKMKEYGTPCTMLTGQECIEEENSRVTASTIEMADIHGDYDVAVIDEAQMIADSDRGHSWTKAILGLKAKEIHICMSPAAEHVITHLIDLCSDTYEITRYERKTKLVCEEEAFLFPEDVQDGDALIVFSKKSVLDVAGRLETQGIKASVIYGSLPPEIRRRQMRLFTSGKTKVVVATDAIGMGLNLPVRRIVFIQTDKYDGVSRRPLTIPEIRQIAGRAGRFGIYETGYVSAMGEMGLSYIKEHLNLPEEPVQHVSLGFPQILLDMKEPLDVILKVWNSVKTPAPFEKVSIEELLYLYEQAYKRRGDIWGFEDKHVLYRMISCPIDIKDRQVVSLWLSYCMNYAADVSLEHPVKEALSGAGIQRYETYYKQLDLYYQFSQRTGKVIDKDWLEKEREKTEAAIMRYLTKDKKNYIATCRYCGRQLPVGYSFGKCERCFATVRGHS